MSGRLPTHPEATADPATVRWMTPPRTLPFVGDVPVPPASLRGLGVASARVNPTSVELTVTDRSLWRTRGTEIRAALVAALAEPATWQPAQHSTTSDVLAEAVREVLAGSVGDFIRSHGGSAKLVEVHHDTAVIAMEGACARCPALGRTLHHRLETAVQRTCGADIHLRVA